MRKGHPPIDIQPDLEVYSVIGFHEDVGGIARISWYEVFSELAA
jgi:uncharacterized membrane protein YkvA (DUF1232 family)